jgi:hypothetical protein
MRVGLPRQAHPRLVELPQLCCALRELGHDDQIILYSTNQYRQDVVAAFDAPRAHGYGNVCCYRGGLADWEDAGYAVEGRSVGSTAQCWPMGTARAFISPVDRC